MCGLIENNIAKSILLNDGVEHTSDPAAPGGGAVYCHEYCEAYFLEGCRITGNSTENQGNGGAFYGCFGSLIQIDGAFVTANQAAGSGGGIYVDGSGSYEGIQHEQSPDNGYGSGATLELLSGTIQGNHALKNGGGVYINGHNQIETVDEVNEYLSGGSFLMENGVITRNQADDAGGGVYVGSAPSGEQGGSFEMTGGALYFNVAGAQGNTSSEIEDAGAEIYSEGGNASLKVRTANEITQYIRTNQYGDIPSEDASVWFTGWYSDYGDQDPVYGKDAAKTETGTQTGRYMTSEVLDRILYENAGAKDQAFLALILDRSTALSLTKEIGTEGNIKPAAGEIYEFQIILPELPDEASRKYPVETTLTEEAGIQKTDTGISYLEFQEDHSACVKLKSSDDLKIQGLPAGTLFTITETGAGSADLTTISTNISVPESLDEKGKTITAATTTDYEDREGFQICEVKFTNIYQQKTEKPPQGTPTANLSLKTDGNSTPVPETGDSSDFLPWILLAAAALALFSRLILSGKHARRS